MPNTPEGPSRPTDPKSRAIQSLLVEKELLSTEAIDRAVSTYEDDIGPRNGKTVVARAWTDPDYRERLFDGGVEAVAEVVDVPTDLVDVQVVENTPEVHNLVVSTLCSCYPWSVLGFPPKWYKSPAYRSRAVREPRTPLAEDSDVELTRDGRDRGLGLELRAPVRGPASATPGNRRDGRVGPRRPRDARVDGRRRAPRRRRPGPG